MQSFLIAFIVAVVCIPIRASVSHQTEVKYLIPDLSQLPSHITKAMRTGEDHRDIRKRGLIVQEYLALTSKNLTTLFTLLNEAGIPFGTPQVQEQFLQPGNTQEIRLMRLHLMINGNPEVQYRISLLGGEELSRSKLETPHTLPQSQQDELLCIFSKLRKQVNNRIHKLYFEINAYGASGQRVADRSGQQRTVEVDLFFNHVAGQNIPVMIAGEIRFEAESQEASYRDAEHFRINKRLHPPYFGRDISKMERLKSRNLAAGVVPGFISSDMEAAYTINKSYFSQFLNEARHWVAPGFYDEASMVVPPEPPARVTSKILLNAEAFGFGPSSVIGEIFPYLRDRTTHLAYIGTGHTLDLQKRLPYDEVHEYSTDDDGRGSEAFRAVAKSYDVFITACDFEAASWAKSLGLDVIIYDPLTWYWKEIPAVVKASDLYIAQNFFAVQKRIADEAGKFPEARVVPPLVSKLYEPHDQNETTLLLVNFGGLSNPYMQADVLQKYIRTIILVVNENFRSKYDEIIYLGSEKLSWQVGTLCEGCNIQTVRPQQVQKLLSRSSLAIMTSGLGNIYEAAVAEKKVVWLPPANDSQGQQLVHLIGHKMIDYSIEWHDILPDTLPVDYFAPQQQVLKEISSRIAQMTNNADAKSQLKHLLTGIFEEESKNKNRAAIKALSDAFSFGGSKVVADNILQWLLERH